MLLLPFFILIAGYFSFPFLINYAKRINYVDEGTSRKRHQDNIPPIGGWLVYSAFALTFFFALLLPSFSLKNLGIFLSVSGVFLLGVIDDKYPMNASKKFAGQFLVAALCVFLGEVHFAEYMSLYGIPYLLGQVLCMIAIVFVINAYNLVDGINGLAAMLGIVAIGFLSLWLFSAGLFSYFILALSVIAALLVFLRYNVFQTLIFLGDNGSMIIGLLATIFAFTFIKTFTGFDSVVLTKCNAEVGIAIAAMAIPIADTLRLFFLRPYYLAKSPFKADRNHVHHLLLRIGFSHAEASLLLFGLSILLVLAALAAQDLGSIAVIFITFSICVAFLMAIDFLVFSRYRRKVNKKTVFNSLQNVSQALGNPVFIEYTFAISMFLLVISIPFHRVSTSIPTLILIFSFIALSIRNLLIFKGDFITKMKGEVAAFLKHPYTWLILVFLLYTLIHLFFIQAEGRWNKWTIYLLLLVYWLSLFQFEKIVQIRPRILLTAFIAGCLGFGIYILMESFVEFPDKGWNGFTYNELLSNVKANPVTHSLYYNLAILFLGNNYKFLKREEWRISYWLMLVFFILMVFLCSSKVGIFILALSLSSAIYNMVRNNKTAWLIIGVIGSLALLIGLRLGLFTLEYIQLAFDSRLVVWMETKQIIAQNLLTGVGVGNSVESLRLAFENIEFAQGLEQAFNAQNQFLESFLETGVFGFLILCLFFVYSLYKSIQERNKLYFVYILVVGIYMMTESLWQTQMGMVSFAFFNALFLASFYHKETISS